MTRRGAERLLHIHARTECARERSQKQTSPALRRGWLLRTHGPHGPRQGAADTRGETASWEDQTWLNSSALLPLSSITNCTGTRDTLPPIDSDRSKDTGIHAACKDQKRGGFASVSQHHGPICDTSRSAAALRSHPTHGSSTQLRWRETSRTLSGCALHPNRSSPCHRIARGMAQTGHRAGQIPSQHASCMNAVSRTITVQFGRSGRAAAGVLGSRVCMRSSSAYRPPEAAREACVPTSTMRP